MRYETSVSTTAAPADTWAVLADVERWPERIEVYQEVRRADAGPLAVGSRARIKQRGLAAGDWVVSEVVEGESFVWENRQPGVRTRGWHVVTAEPGGGSRLTLGLEQSGWLAGVVGLVLGGRVRAYVDLECERLSAAAAEAG